MMWRFLCAILILAIMLPAIVLGQTGPGAAKGDREGEVSECINAGGLWIGAASTEHPAYVPDGRCAIIMTVPELPEDREAVCAAYGGFWLPEKGDGIAACAYRKLKKN